MFLFFAKIHDLGAEATATAQFSIMRCQIFTLQANASVLLEAEKEAKLWPFGLGYWHYAWHHSNFMLMPHSGDQTLLFLRKKIKYSFEIKVLKKIGLSKGCR
ncbi:hypothetical protein K1719_034108 [Acacia pycnantha]|nr:hypothetical protein K1719_034108 [Acacia pycnantha]